MLFRLDFQHAQSNLYKWFKTHNWFLTSPREPSHTSLHQYPVQVPHCFAHFACCFSYLKHLVQFMKFFPIKLMIWIRSVRQERLQNLQSSGKHRKLWQILDSVKWYCEVKDVWWFYFNTHQLSLQCICHFITKPVLKSLSFYICGSKQDFHMVWFCLWLWFLVGEFSMFFMSLVLSATCFSQCPLYNYIEAQISAALVDVRDVILIRITNFLKKSVVWSSNELQFSKWQFYSKSHKDTIINPHTIFLLWQPFCGCIIQYYLFQM